MSDSKPEETVAEEGFISRWSRRKQISRAELEGVAEEALDDADVADIAEAAVEEELPDDSDMPPLESLDEDSDYSGFMSPRVSDELRNLALRKLFLSGMFSQRDGLDDYDDDFTSFEKLGDVITAEMRHQMERLKNAVGDDMSEELLDDKSEVSSAETVVSAEQDGDVEDVAAMNLEKDAGDSGIAGPRQDGQGEESPGQKNEDKQHKEEGNVSKVE